MTSDLGFLSGVLFVFTISHFALGILFRDQLQSIAESLKYIADVTRRDEDRNSA